MPEFCRKERIVGYSNTQMIIGPKCEFNSKLLLLGGYVIRLFSIFHQQNGT